MGRKAGIGEAEMEVLRCLGESGPQSVRGVAERLEPVRGWTRTTTLNLMERLRAKGHLVREPGEDGIFVYRLARTESGLVRGVVSKFVTEMLGGSIQPLLAYLAEDATPTEAELATLRTALARLEERR